MFASVITNPSDKDKEFNHITVALEKCGYPAWAFEKSREQVTNQADRPTAPSDKRRISSRGMITLPYINGVTELCHGFLDHIIYRHA